jgi:tetratricopeptide (TPR) repeat protein
VIFRKRAPDAPGRGGDVSVAGVGAAGIGGNNTAPITTHVTHNTYLQQVAEAAGRAAVVMSVVGEAAAAPTVFAGRDREITAVLNLLDPAGSGPGTTVVSAVAGLAGVGKTALAGRVASMAVGRGWFPGGAWQVDLHGYDPHSLIGVGQAFAPLLHALRVDADQIPAAVGEQATALHQVLTEMGQQGLAVLLVLDNASTTDQVADLLPAHRAHRVLVTSRHTLGDLPGVRIVDLDVLPADQAVRVLDAVLRQRNPADERITAQPGPAEQLVGLCAGLPLALQITAALLADDPDQPVATLVDELSHAEGRLDTLAYGQRGVRATFDLSWQHLRERDQQAARLFLLMSCEPGPDISTLAAAALADQPVAATTRLLRTLRRAHLIEPGTAPGRWRMHDLVRLYATQLSNTHTTTADRTAAVHRLHAHYLDTARAANAHLRALPGQPVPDRFTDRAQALTWLDTERPNLIAAVHYANNTRRHRTTTDLADNLAEFLQWRRHLADWVSIATLAVQAATHLGDLRRHGDALTILGLALHEVRRFEEAITAHQQAGTIYRETGDRHGEGIALDDLGLALQGVRRFEEAITAHQQAGTVFCETGDRHREGGALNSLGLALQGVRRFEEAITAHQQAATIYRETGDRHREGGALNSLGLALQGVRRFEEAITAHQQAATIYRETGDQHREGGALTNLGLAKQDVEQRTPDDRVEAAQNILNVNDVSHEAQLDVLKQAGRHLLDERERLLLENQLLDPVAMIRLHLQRNPGDTAGALEMVAQLEAARLESREKETDRWQTFLATMADQNMVQPTDVAPLLSAAVRRMEASTTPPQPKLPDTAGDAD